MKDNIFQYIIVPVVFITIIVVFFKVMNSSTTNNIKNDSYRGVIKEIYNDKNNHDVYIFSFQSQNENSKEIAEWFPYSWKYATVGDSIIKEKGDLYITIKKKSGHSKIFYFDP